MAGLRQGREVRLLCRSGVFFSLQHSEFVRPNIFLDLILPRRKTVCVNTLTSDPLTGLAALLGERNLSPAAREAQPKEF